MKRNPRFKWLTFLEKTRNVWPRRLSLTLSIAVVLCENAFCIEPACQMKVRFAVRVYDKVLMNRMPPSQRELMDSVFVGLDSLKNSRNPQESSLTLCEHSSYSAFQNGEERWAYMSKRNGDFVLLLLKSGTNRYPVYGELFSFDQYRVPEEMPLLSQISRLLGLPPTSLVVKEIPKCDIGERQPIVYP